MGRGHGPFKTEETRKKHSFCSMGRGGRGPDYSIGGNMSVEIGGMVPVFVLRADKVQEAAY